MIYDIDDRSKWEHLVPFGFAPGGYSIRCGGCSIEYRFAAKRATRCPVCAEQDFKNYQIVMDNFDLFKYAERAAKLCGNSKHQQFEILSALTEESGELSTEIQIAHGKKDRDPGKDGIVGEAVDVIITALDMIHSELGSIDPVILKPIFKKKLDKWIEKYSKDSV